MKPRNTRAAIYVLIAMLTAFQQGFKAGMDLYSGTQFVVSVILAGLVVYRAFIDQTTNNQPADPFTAPAATQPPTATATKPKTP